MPKRARQAICLECRQPFEPANPRYFICPACWKAEYQQGERCAAVRDDGLPCGGWAMRGRAFCASHMKQGYALFELAARRADKHDDERV